MIIPLLIALSVLIFAEKIIKHVLVVRFFGQAIPSAKQAVGLVSILQPILSGDPSLAEGLEQNLSQRTGYPLEFIWLVDDDDLAGQSICQTLIERYPQMRIQMLLLPPPQDRQNPKMLKLIAGARVAKGDVLCVLDDDTRLPDYSLETCLPYLDLPAAGLAFGLPYYVNFGNFWSQLVAYFVNSHSLMTYIPYAMLTPPFTINGMFYAMRREVLETIGAFDGLEHVLADDFAIARRVRAHGLRLVQTPLRHAISTTVPNSRGYLHLIQRWFIFPRESMMRHLSGRELVFFYASAVLPVGFPWLAIMISLIEPRLWPLTLFYFVYDYCIFAHFNWVYLRQASPWLNAYWVPLIALWMPIQVFVALLAPQRILWRGHVIQVEAGGGLQFLQRRNRK